MYRNGYGRKSRYKLASAAPSVDGALHNHRSRQLRHTVSMATILAVLCGVASPSVFAASASTSYPWTLTKGLVCKSEAELKTALNFIANKTGPNPQVACGVIVDGDLQSTATPLDAFKNDAFDGTIIQYDTIDMGTLYGIVSGDGAKPASTTPAPSSSDVNI